MRPLDISHGLEGTHVLVTGGAGHIGSIVVSSFLSAGAKVTCLDVSAAALNALESSYTSSPSSWPSQSSLRCGTVDISNETALEAAFANADKVFGPVACCVALASLDLSVLEHRESIMDIPMSQWQETLNVNLTGTFLTARAWLRSLKRVEGLRPLANRSLIIVGSESGLFGERGNADYATAKSAVQGGLLQSLKADVPRVSPGARVNAIAPGPVDTARFREECKADPNQLYIDAQATTAMGRPVDVEGVARTILYLASERFSGGVHGQVLRIDSGKEGKIMWREGELKPSDIMSQGYHDTS